MLFVILAFTCVLFGQEIDSTVSVVRKDVYNQALNYSPIKEWYPSYYPMMVNFIIQQRAHEDDPFAQHELGLRYLLGRGVKADTVKAIYWIKKAIEKKLPLANFNYALILYNDLGNIWNPFSAYENFLVAAEAGMAEAQYAIGLAHIDNLVVNRDLTKAYEWLARAAKQGYKYAADILPELEKLGAKPINEIADWKNYNAPKGSIIDKEWEIDYMDYDLKAKNIDNKSYLEELLTKNRFKIAEMVGIEIKDTAFSPSKNINIGIINKAGENGSPEALTLIGKYYEYGIFYKKDLLSACEYYLRAYRLGETKTVKFMMNIMQSQDFLTNLLNKAKQGNVQAMYIFSGMAAIGMINYADNKELLEQLTRAADKNHIPSLIELGLFYISDNYGKKDFEKAYNCWEKAIALGSNEAKLRLLITKLFNSKEKDLAGTFEELIISAENGSVIAQAALGYCFEKGIGVKINKGTAITYYKKAANRGNVAAFESLKQMFDALRPNEAKYKIYAE